MTYWPQKLTITSLKGLLKIASLALLISCPNKISESLALTNMSYPEEKEDIIAHMPLNVGAIKTIHLPKYLVKKHLTEAQITNAFIIMATAKNDSFDAAMLLAIALQESAFNNKAVSKGLDIGLYQISTYWWGAYFRNKTGNFRASAMNPVTSTKFAIEILYILSSYETCQGEALFGCYNGGPQWRKSKNKSSIIAYKNKVSFHYRMMRKTND